MLDCSSYPGGPHDGSSSRTPHGGSGSSLLLLYSPRRLLLLFPYSHGGSSSCIPMVARRRGDLMSRQHELPSPLLPWRHGDLGVDGPLDAQHRRNSLSMGSGCATPPGPARALQATMPSGMARHDSSTIVPCLGHRLGTVTQYNTARQRSRTPSCRASPCHCRAMPRRPIQTCIVISVAQ